jgi:hypothetical protein
LNKREEKKIQDFRINEYETNLFKEEYSIEETSIWINE